MVYRVFLSSTSRDLVAHREAVLAAIVRLDGFEPIAMENFGARADAAIDFDDRKVRDSQVLVGLLGLCYGSHPRAGPPSFTEREYESALAAGIDRLMFVSPDDFPVPGNLIETAGKRTRQRKLRARVKADLIVDGGAAFASPAALATAVVIALANWRVDQITNDLVAGRAAELGQTLAGGEEAYEAVRAAVQALAEKAREADASPNVEHALALLPEGRTAEAEAIFADIVARKGAEGRLKQEEGAAALREAAEAARHLGALAALDDTAKAIEAYRIATELDPGDAWSWIYLGLLHQQAGHLARAERAFEQASAAAEAAGATRDASVAEAYSGDVRRARGHLDEAHVSYGRALAAQTQVAAQDPGNAGWQRDLSVSFNKIGDVQLARGDLEGGLQAYRDSLAIREKLAAQDPGNAGWQRDLSVSFDRIGDVQLARGDLEGGLQAYRDSLAIREKLAAQDPGNAEWQRDLIVSHWKLAALAEAQDGQADEAARRYRAALDLAVALRDGSRLAPADAWMVDELEARLARVSQAAAR